MPGAALRDNELVFKNVHRLDPLTSQRIYVEDATLTARVLENDKITVVASGIAVTHVTNSTTGRYRVELDYVAVPFVKGEGYFAIAEGDSPTAGHIYAEEWFIAE